MISWEYEMQLFIFPLKTIVAQKLKSNVLYAGNPWDNSWQKTPEMELWGKWSLSMSSVF